jgi:tetratricopeptide (TPR) repeat protein
MASPDSIFWSAVDAYVAADNRYASIRFRQAAELAREYTDETLWFKATVWAAEALFSMDDLRAAFSAIMMARLEEPQGDGFEHWLCRKLQFKIGLAWKPLRNELEAMLNDLAQYHRRCDFAKHDLYIMRGRLFAARGAWEEALSHFETGFKSRAEDDSTGSTRNSIAYDAADCCIILRRFSAAEDWIKAIYDRSEWEKGWVNTIPRYQAHSQLRLARARHKPFSEIKHLFRKFDELCLGVDEKLLRDAVRRELVRVELLNPDGGDPASPLHPSRNACRDLSGRMLSWHFRFDHTLLALDYRLACLRFAVGVVPIDDEFDKVVPSLGKLVLSDQYDFDRRLLKAREALHRAQNRSAALDAMLESNWRTKEVEARAIWINAITSAGRVNRTSEPRLDDQ